MKNISAAFVKAQKEFGVLLKDSNNPFFKSKYADLSSCVGTVLNALNNNGIGLIQNCHESDNGVIVETVFVHESGEQLSCGKLHVPAIKQDPQQYGSALTYARRYSLMAACGIAPEDDDGNAASQQKPKVTATTNLKPPPLSDKELDNAIEEFGKTTDIETLQGIFGGAYKRANESQRVPLQSSYNYHKSKLEKAA